MAQHWESRNLGKKVNHAGVSHIDCGGHGFYSEFRKRKWLCSKAASRRWSV